MPPDLVKLLKTKIFKGDSWDKSELEASVKQHDSPLARIVFAGIGRAGRPALEIEKVLEDALLAETAQARFWIRPITAVAAIAPLFGLTGTVLGMIHSFANIGNAKVQLKAATLAQGVNEALVCTAAGLIVGIIALILAYFLTGWLDYLAQSVGKLVVELPIPLASKLSD